MKRLIAAVILLAFVLGSYLIGYGFIFKTCKETNRLLEECNIAYDLNMDAESATKKLEKFWSDKESKLSFFLNHSQIDQIELAISSLRVYSDTKNNEIFREYSGTVQTLLHQIMEDTKPTVHSIF